MPDDITDFEICEFHKNTKIWISQEQRKHWFLRIECYFIAKNNFVAEVIFNTRNRELNFKNTLWALCPVFLLISLVVTCTLMPWLYMPQLETPSDLLKVNRVSKNIFAIISLHCMKVKTKEKMLLRRFCLTFTPSIRWIQAQTHPIQGFPNSGKEWGWVIRNFTWSGGGGFLPGEGNKEY